METLLHGDFGVPVGEDCYRELPENISVDSDVLLQKTKQTEKTTTTTKQLQIVLKRKKLKQFSLANLGLGSCQSREGCKTKKTKELRDY